MVELLLTLLHCIQKKMKVKSEQKVLGAQRLLGLESLQTDGTPAVCHSPSSLQTLRKGETKETDCQGLQFSSPGEVEHFDSRVLQESKEWNLRPPVGREPLPPASGGSPVASKSLKWT